MAGAGLRIATCTLGVLLLCGWTGDGTASPSVDFKAAQADASNLATLRRLLDQPEGKIDLARAKVMIDRMVDPRVDTEATLRELDQWVAKARARIPPGASNRVKTDFLLSTLYKPGPWNGNKPFGYDYADPYGRDLHNALLSTYFARCKGQCIIMPIALLLLGQKLGLPMTITTAPRHLIVKYGDEERGEWTNLDATSGLFHPDSSYQAAMRIPDKALDSGIYLRPYTQREAVALFAVAVLVPHYLQQKKINLALQAADLILKVNPKEVHAMLLKSDAYVAIVDSKFRSKYPDPNKIPIEFRTEFIADNKKIVEWRQKATDLGYKEWTKEDSDRYLKLFNDSKSKQARGGG